MSGHLIKPAVATWDVVAMVSLAALAAAESSGVTSAGHVTFGSLAALLMIVFGSFCDWMLRDKLYRNRLAEGEPARECEMRDRTVFAAIGMAFGSALAMGLNGWIEVSWPVMAVNLAPAVNFICVMNAVLIIEFIRGIMKMLTGQDVRQTLVGLILKRLQSRDGSHG